MDKKSLPLVILCVLLILLWEPVVSVFRPPRLLPKPASTNQVTVATLPAATTIPSPGDPSPGTGILAQLAPEAEAVQQTKVLQNEDLSVEFTPAGGAIRRVTLKQYLENGLGPVPLNHQSPLPCLAVAVGDVPLMARYDLSENSNQMRAEHASPSGLRVSKEFTLQPDHRLQAKVTLQNTGPSNLLSQTLRVGLGMANPLNPKDTPEYIGITTFLAGGVKHDYLAALQKEVAGQKGPAERGQGVIWAAVKNQYFVLLTTPETPFASLLAQPYELPLAVEAKGAKKQHGILALMTSTPFDLSSGASTNWTFSLYAGPMEYKKLVALKEKQSDVLDYGIFAIFSKALLWFMEIFFRAFGNWGVAIICVTVVIKIIFWPLTAMSTRSMKQMQALAPKINELKEKYRDDPKRVGPETMKLYREYRINPMAGCLPMLIQIPILIGFFWMLRTAVELRGASFLWIRDLSLPDTVARIPGLDFPINPIPLIMAVTMIWQTKITPQPPNQDPAMRMMMWLMPAMFLFFCYNFSSGLSLYWTAQNLLTILQTYMTKDKPVEPPQRTRPKSAFTFSRPLASQKR